MARKYLLNLYSHRNEIKTMRCYFTSIKAAKRKKSKRRISVGKDEGTLEPSVLLLGFQTSTVFWRAI